jgi:hypothetical protein
MHDTPHPRHAPKGGESKARAAPRTNLFLAATLYSAAGTSPVKIRDLSSAGARIESDVVPVVGEPIRLVRGSLSVVGLVAWRRERRCGLRFDASISVPGWMANTVNREQQRVDRAVKVMHAGAVPLAIPATRRAGTADDMTQDLKRVSCLLELLGDELANDMLVAANYGVKLQYLDIAVQTLLALAESVGSGNLEPYRNMARLDSLRRSCIEALSAGP